MKDAAIFFGSQGDAWLEHQRQAAVEARTGKLLASRLKELQAERAELQWRNGREIAERTSRLADGAAQLEQARQRAAALNVKRDQLTRSLGSFWIRLGLRLRHLFATGAPSLQQVRERLADTAREAREAEEAADKLAAARRIELDELQRLTVPLESVEFAISFLEQQQQTLQEHTEQRRADIDRLIRRAARTADPLLLWCRLAALPPEVDRQQLGQCVLKLKSLLILLERLNTVGNSRSREPSGTAPAADPNPVAAELAGDPQPRLMRALAAGFLSQSGEGRGQLQLRGEGRKNVRRTRRRAVSLHDRRGGRGLQHRTETYWEPVPVQLAGSLEVSLSIPYRGWRAEPLVQALCDESRVWFRNGVSRGEAATLDPQRAAAQSEAAELTERIRQLLGIY